MLAFADKGKEIAPKNRKRDVAELREYWTSKKEAAKKKRTPVDVADAAVAVDGG